MDKNKTKVQCDIIVDFDKLDKKFICVQRLTIGDLENMLNSRTIDIKCVDINFIKEIINKMTNRMYVKEYADYKKYECTIQVYFDKHIIIINNVIPTGSFDFDNGVSMVGDNVIIRENEFINNYTLVIERTVNYEVIETRGYVLNRPDEITYKINPIKR